MKKEVTRREVLTGAASSVALLFSALALGGDKIPNGPFRAFDRRIGMTNTLPLPLGMLTTCPELTIQVAINFGAMYKTDMPNNVNLGPHGGDLWGFGEAIRKALRRGQDVYMILETPSKASGVNLADWGLYVSKLAERFQGANFVIGNEVNIDPDWKDDPTGYVNYLLSAMAAIKPVSQNSKLILGGDAYFGNFEFYEKLITVARQMAWERGESFDQMLDGTAMHFYDQHNKLPDRVANLAELLNKLRLPPNIYLTELGKPEGLFPITQTRQAEILFYNMLVALPLVINRVLSYVSWFNAYMPDDPHGHNLIRRVFPDQFVPTLAFALFWNMADLCSGEIGIKQDANGRYVVSGVTSRGRRFSYTLPRWSL